MAIINLAGHPQSKATRIKIAEAQTGKGNSNFKHGKRMNYRKIVKAANGQLVHHKDGNRANNTKSNLVKQSASKHNTVHKREKNFGK
jgi:hypothetical protein